LFPSPFEILLLTFIAIQNSIRVNVTSCNIEHVSVTKAQSPLTSTQKFFQTAQYITEQSLLATLKVAFDNIESATNTLQTEPETPFKNKNPTQKTNRTASTQLQKFFSALILSLPN